MLNAHLFFAQKPFSTRHLGTKSWTAQVEYPGWAQFIIAVIVLLCIAPCVCWTIVWLIKHWNGVWRSAVWDKLSGGLVEYHPDPTWPDPSRRVSAAVMKKTIEEEEKRDNKLWDGFCLKQTHSIIILGHHSGYLLIITIYKKPSPALLWHVSWPIPTGLMERHVEYFWTTV